MPPKTSFQETAIGDILLKPAPMKDAEVSTGRQESVTCACGRNDEENEEDGGEEEERRMVFLGQLLKTSVPLLAFK